MPPIETPPRADRSPDVEPAAELETTDAALRRGRRGNRYQDLDTHELITLLDEVDDERSRARFREAVYISVIVWFILGWIMVYGPRYLWHAPVLVTAVDKPSKEMTYLDVPPNLQKQLQRTKPTPNISTKSTEAQSPKPSPRAPEPRAGTPTPPAPKPAPQPAQQQPKPAQQQPPPTPQPQQQPQQQARNTPPTPTPSRSQPLADAPAPSPNKPSRNIFNQPGSASDQIQQAAKNARGGEGGDYGSVGAGKSGGKMGTEIISDTQGVDFAKYLARLLADVRRNWLPLIPEECRPPLNKQGITGVRFTIQPNGTISAMHLDYSTHDVAIDRAAWGGITAMGAAQPLPKEFHGPNLELRIEFRINKDGQDAQ